MQMPQSQVVYKQIHTFYVFENNIYVFDRSGVRPPSLPLAVIYAKNVIFVNGSP